MSSYFNLTLDTTGPSGVSVKINGDDNNTTTTAATLTISCDESDTSNCMMKVWGDINDSMGNPISTEADAVWQNFSPTLNIVLTECSGGENETKTVFVKVRDDVWNESIAVSDTITLYVVVPTVSVISSISRISKISTKAMGLFSFTVDKPCNDLKVMVVSSVNSLVNDPSNAEIIIDNNGEDMPLGEYIVSNADGIIEKGREYGGIISGTYLEKASEGDGVKIIKLFARGQNGAWSV